MFYKILFFILISTLLYSGEIVWSSGASQSVSDTEYNEAIREYVAQKYPKELKAWEKEQIVIIGNLIWQDDEAAKTVEKDWEGAMAYCKSLDLLGFNDWRLPTKSELKEIVDTSRKPTIKKEFKNVNSSYYWSSSTFKSPKGWAWTLSFYHGMVGGSLKNNNRYVRCVRVVDNLF